MNNSSIKTPLLLIGIFLFLVIILVVLFLRNSTTDVAVNDPVPPDTNNTPQQVITTGTSILTKTGTQLQTRDFLQDADVELWDRSSETYLIAQEFSPQGTLFQIFYVMDGGITVSLQDADLRFARQRAESALKDKLNVSQIELCALVVRVTVPSAVNEEYSGIDLRLSDCPGALII